MTAPAHLVLATLVAVTALAGCGGDGAAPASDASVDSRAAPTWDGFAREFFESYCWACHGPGDTTRDFSLLEEVRTEADTIKAGVAAGTFPIGDGPRPSQLERDELVEWIDLGAPE